MSFERDVTEVVWMWFADTEYWSSSVYEKARELLGNEGLSITGATSKLSNFLATAFWENLPEIKGAHLKLLELTIREVDYWAIAESIIGDAREDMISEGEGE